MAYWYIIMKSVFLRWYIKNTRLTLCYLTTLPRYRGLHVHRVVLNFTIARSAGFGSMMFQVSNLFREVK